MLTAAVTGLGAAFPAAVAQEALWDGFFRAHFADSRLAPRVFAGSGVHHRHSVVNPVEEDVSGWSTAARMRRYAREAPPLGHQAAVAALADAGLAAEDLGLLTVASCTGYSTPGLDIRLAGSLGVGVDTRRLLVGHMGCYAALPALASTADFVAARGRPALVLCLELTSLHLQPPTRDAEQVVAHALFGDAAAAAVVQPAPAAGAAPGGAAGLEVVDVAALTVPDSSGDMSWQVTDHGFRMGLSPRVPRVLARHVRPEVEGLLARHDLKVADVRGWAVHPGGPRILDTVEEELALPPQALHVSREVLAEHGNCSSATVLLVLRRLAAAGREGTAAGREGGTGDASLAGGAEGGGGPLPAGAAVVALAFGPGLTLYAALLRARRPAGGGPEVR